jgi:hypothetical protein
MQYTRLPFESQDYMERGADPSRGNGHRLRERQRLWYLLVER